MDKYKIKDLNERLDKESNQEHKNKMLYMWVKQDHISLSEYNELVKNHGVSHHVSKILIWIVKNSQHQVWSISRSEEEAKEILKHHQKDHPDEYFYIESEEI